MANTKNLKAKDIERLENTSMASLLAGIHVHTTEGQGGEAASPLCCINCSGGTVCTFGGVCCTGQTCEECSAASCGIGCTEQTCTECTGLTCGACTESTCDGCSVGTCAVPTNAGDILKRLIP